MDLIHVWAKLQTSDHFYYISTKGSTDGKVHKYFSPYGSPYDGYIYYMNALSDLEITLNTRNRRKKELEALASKAALAVPEVQQIHI